MKDIDSTQVFRTKTWYFTSRWAPNLFKATLTSSGIPHKLCGEIVGVLGGYPKSILICRVWIVPTFAWLYSIDSCEFHGKKHHSHTLSQVYNQLLYDIHQCGCFLKWWYPQNTPKWSFLVGKPMVVGYHHFRKPPYHFCHHYQLYQLYLLADKFQCPSGDPACFRLGFRPLGLFRRQMSGSLLASPGLWWWLFLDKACSDA